LHEFCAQIFGINMVIGLSMPRVDRPPKGELRKFEESLRVHGSKTLHNLLFAVVIWLFAVLVFIPIAKSIGREIEIIVSLLLLIIFTIVITRTAPGMKILIDAFSVLPARKYSQIKKLAYKDSLVLFRYIIYIIFIVIAYLFYLPFLSSFHSALAGIVLILVIFFIFILALKIFSIIGHKTLDWLYDSKSK